MAAKYRSAEDKSGLNSFGDIILKKVILANIWEELFLKVSQAVLQIFLQSIKNISTNYHSIKSNIIQPSQYWDYIRLKHKEAKIFENHINPVMLVFIW